MKIKFNKYHVTNGEIKARIRYSIGNRIDNRNCVTLYALDYDGKLGKIFVNGEYRNDTDIQTDYFECGIVDLFENHLLYEKALGKATGQSK